MKKLMTLVAMVTALAFGPPGAARAEYPERPVRLLSNSVPGGGGDMLARLLGKELTARLGQPFIVDNKAGAGGNIAGELVAKAAGDGYTFLLADSGPLVVNPSLYKEKSFDPLKDFAPVARLASIPIVLLAHPSLGASRFEQLVIKARAAPGTIAYATPGVGSTQHLAAELMSSQIGIKLLHVPYKGGAAALADVLAGHVPIGFIGLPPTMPHLRTGVLKGLAISSPVRSALAPEVPAMAESGLPGFSAMVWFGMVAPRGTSPAVVAKVHAAVNAILAEPAIRAKLEEMGYAADPSTLPEFVSYMAEETDRWHQAVRLSGARQ